MVRVDARPILTAILIVAIAFAGCSSGGEDAGGELTAPSDGSIGDGTSRLVVLVTDDTLLPLQNVSVALLEVEDSLRMTNADGHASYDGLEPGSYTVAVQRLGYESVAKKVTLEPDAEQTVSVELRSVVVAATFFESFPYVGHLGCGAGVVVTTVTWNCVVSSNHQVTWDTEVRGDVMTILGELVWERSSSFSAQAFNLVAGMDETCNPCSFEHGYGGQTGPSPVILRVDGDDGGLDGMEDPKATYEVRHRIWVPGDSGEATMVVIVLEQPVELWVTTFYGEPMAAGFTAIPDA